MAFAVLTSIVKKINFNIKSNIDTPVSQKEGERYTKNYVDLGDYYQLNLDQIKVIFVTSITVMLIGFLLIAFSLIWSLFSIPNQSDTNREQSYINYIPSIVGGICGIITNFIGATFLFLYQSAVRQASQHTRSLERANSLKLAKNLLDEIKTKAQESNETEKIIESQFRVIALLIDQSKINLDSDKKEEKN